MGCWNLFTLQSHLTLIIQKCPEIVIGTNTASRLLTNARYKNHMIPILKNCTGCQLTIRQSSKLWDWLIYKAINAGASVSEDGSLLVLAWLLSSAEKARLQENTFFVAPRLWNIFPRERCFANTFPAFRNLRKNYFAKF